MACLLWLAYYRPLRKYLRQKALFDRMEMKRFFQVNRDIFFRTLCLIAVTVFFTSTGAAYGDVVLAVNALLMQLFTLYSYFMDGFAYAGEALTGKYIGAKDNQSLRLTIRHLFKCGIALSLLFTLLYGAGGKAFSACSPTTLLSFRLLKNISIGYWPFRWQDSQPFCSMESVSVPQLLA